MFKYDKKIMLIYMEKTREWHDSMSVKDFNALWCICIDLIKKTKQEKGITLSNLAESCRDYVANHDLTALTDFPDFTSEHMLWFCLEYLLLGNEQDLPFEEYEHMEKEHKRISRKLRIDEGYTYIERPDGYYMIFSGDTPLNAEHVVDMLKIKSSNDKMVQDIESVLAQPVYVADTSKIFEDSNYQVKHYTFYNLIMEQADRIDELEQMLYDVECELEELEMENRRLCSQ